MQKIYVWRDKLFKESSIDLYVDYLITLKIKYLGTRQDCLDWIVYSPYFLVDMNSDTEPIIMSYGLAKTNDGEQIYCTEFESIEKFDFIEWFDSVEAIWFYLINGYELSYKVSPVPPHEAICWGDKSKSFPGYLIAPCDSNIKTNQFN